MVVGACWGGLEGLLLLLQLVVGVGRELLLGRLPLLLLLLGVWEEEEEQ